MNKQRLLEVMETPLSSLVDEAERNLRKYREEDGDLDAFNSEFVTDQVPSKLLIENPPIAKILVMVLMEDNRVEHKRYGACPEDDTCIACLMTKRLKEAMEVEHER